MIKKFCQLVWLSVKEWNDDDPFRHGAIIAYYAIFSMPGLLMMIIWMAGALYGEEAVLGQISEQINTVLGGNAAKSIEEIIANAEINQNSLLMKVLGVATLIFGATTIFLQLQKSLNQMWEVKSAPANGIIKLLTDRMTSLGLIVVIAFLLLMTLLLSTTLSLIGTWIESYFGESLLLLIHIFNVLISMGVTTLLFAVMFKVLPDVDILWRSVWVGAITASLLFTLGKTLLGIYFGYAEPGSTFGAAGTIILVMLWVNYTCLIMFFGAKISQVHAISRGHPIQPSKHAEWTAEHYAESSKFKKNIVDN